MNQFRGKATDNMAKPINNFFQRGKYFIAKPLLPDFFPDLFNRIHLRGVWRNVKQYYVIRYLERFGFMPGSTIATQQNYIFRIFLGKFLEKDIHAHSVAIRHDQKAWITGQRLHRTIGVTVFPNMMAWDSRSAPFLAPTILGFVDPTKSSFILKH